MNPEGNVYNAVGRINRLGILTINAYEIAVKNGFNGTEEEWLESLVGVSPNVQTFGVTEEFFNEDGVVKSREGTEVSITDKDGTKTFNVWNGSDGKDALGSIFYSTERKNDNWGLGKFISFNTETIDTAGRVVNVGDFIINADGALHKVTNVVTGVCLAKAIMDLNGGGNVDLTGYATEQFVRDGYQPKGDYLESSALPIAVNDALAQAKASGEFDGKDGKDGKDGQDGSPGAPGENGKDGTSVTVSKVTESTAEGGSNVVTFSDGKTLTVKNGKTGADGKNGADGKDGADYVLTDADKDEIAETLKAEVPLVKTAEQPTFVDSVEKMTDTSKVYVMPDGYMWANMKVGAKTLTANDVVVTNVLADGTLQEGAPRIATKELLPCGEKTISISCPSPYQYFIYFYTDDDTSTFIGKTTWVSGDIVDVLTATVGSGTSSGAKYCRISLRDSTNSSAVLTGRIDEFMSAITIKQGTDSQKAWTNTGHLYVQPAEKPYYTLQGKNITCFGDSLAANCYVGSVKQWIQRVGEFFQCGKIYNRGVGGSAVSSINGSGNERNNYAAFNADGEAYLRISYKTGEAPMEIPEGYTEMKASMELDERVNTIPLDTDILLIEAGTNDNDLDADTLAAAYDRMLVKIQTRLPNAKIIILGLPFVNPRIYSTDAEREYLRNKLDELMGGIREVAKKYGIPVIEIKDTAQVNLINYTNYMSNDALHYDTEAGTKRWAETVIKGMFGTLFLQ